MPQETINGGFAQQAGTGTGKRAAKKGQGRKAGLGKEKASPKIIADSVFAISLKELPGVVAMERIGGNTRKYSSCNDDDFVKMYHDLFECMKLGLKLVKNEETSFDPLANGFQIGFAINYVVNLFKEHILPKGFDFNVDRYNGEGDYYFTIYDSCKFDEYWHSFEIKPVVSYLHALDVEIHDCFLEVMRSLMDHADILNWWNGGMGYAEYMLEEEVEEWEERNGDFEETMEQYISAKSALQDYKEGRAKEYEVILQTCVASRPISGILLELQKFDRTNPVVKWMEECCFFLMVPGCMNDFIYTEMEDSMNEIGLRFMDQVTIIWDEDDYYTHIQCDIIDSEVNGVGTVPPVINWQLSKETREFNIQQLRHRMEWPDKLSALYRHYVEMVQTIKNQNNGAKQQDGNSDEHLQAEVGDNGVPA